MTTKKINKKILKEQLNKINNELDKVHTYDVCFNNKEYLHISITDGHDNELFNIPIEIFNKDYQRVIDSYIRDYERDLLATKVYILEHLKEKFNL